MERLLDFIKKMFGCESPSQVARKFGGYFGEGFSIGTAEGSKDIEGIRFIVESSAEQEQIMEDE